MVQNVLNKSEVLSHQTAIFYTPRTFQRESVHPVLYVVQKNSISLSKRMSRTTNSGWAKRISLNYLQQKYFQVYYKTISNVHLVCLRNLRISVKYHVI